MDFDEIYKRDSGHGRHDDDHYYEKRYHDEYKHRRHPDNDIKQVILSKFLNNPKFKILVVSTVIFIIILVVLAIILLWPLFMKFLSFITENGLQGLVDSIWKGTNN